MGEYHAAAGKHQLEADHRVSRVTNADIASALALYLVISPWYTAFA
jgi:hypothetical protein